MLLKKKVFDILNIYNCKRTLTKDKVDLSLKGSLWIAVAKLKTVMGKKCSTGVYSCHSIVADNWQNINRLLCLHHHHYINKYYHYRFLNCVHHNREIKIYFFVTGNANKQISATERIVIARLDCIYFYMLLCHFNIILVLLLISKYSGCVFIT